MQQLTIGAFARLTHLSVKTLRYYHEVGLLSRPWSIRTAATGTTGQARRTPRSLSGGSAISVCQWPT